MFLLGRYLTTALTELQSAKVKVTTLPVKFCSIYVIDSSRVLLYVRSTDNPLLSFNAALDNLPSFQNQGRANTARNKSSSSLNCSGKEFFNTITYRRNFNRLFNPTAITFTICHIMSPIFKKFNLQIISNVIFPFKLYASLDSWKNIRLNP